MTVKVTRQHLDFATLVFEILFACEEALFGLMWQDYFDNEERDTQTRIIYDKTSEHFESLPEEFTTKNVMDTWGYSSNTTASARIKTLIESGAVRKIGHGHFQKLRTAI